MCQAYSSLTCVAVVEEGGDLGDPIVVLECEGDEGVVAVGLL